MQNKSFSFTRFSAGLLLLASVACSSSTKEEPRGAAPKATPSTPGATSAAPVPAGASSGKREYDLEIDSPIEAKVGGEMKTKIILTPTGNLHINQEFPHKLSLASLPPGVECPKTVFAKEDAATFSETRAEYTITCTAKEAGVKSFSGEYKLSVCTDNYCATPKEPLAWSVEVK